ncbi:sensor histidine kinase [Brevundimonas diminuta]|jgi:signal transduction histidine kinase|nr:ATP-binding protein [Brevundimonas diminuta]QQB87956.1 hypothetical protein I6H83_12430 [Brevundimonas diminuta]GEC00308.1 hypothetical protein BDI01nite_13720 [Brevundimonas diminuta]
MTVALRPLDAPQWTDAALSALNICAAAFDTRGLTWRSPAFVAAFPEWREGETLASVECRLPGLNEAIVAARREGASDALIVQPGGRRVHDVRLALSDGLVFLELSDAAERQEAQQRHLADREELLTTSRVLSVGEMATMIAHELNQPIGSIANILRGLKARLQRGALTLETGAEALDRATEQALYASGVIQRVRTFVDQRQPQVQRLDLARLARNTLDLLDWEITRDRVTARAATPPDLPAVLGDPVMVQQVLVNLARNALDAMRGVDLPRRELTIEARHSLDARQIELTLTDTGPGVPEEASARVFSPFFSTRSGGMGVGLGICRSIIELHRGRLWFTPGEAGGSVFHIALPLAAAEIPTEEARP